MTNPSGPDLHRDALLLLPLLAALIFVHLFARAFPLTDEWTYTYAIRQLHDVDWSAPGAMGELIRLFPTRFNEHLVGFPFLLYWPLAEWSNFDSRWMIHLTIAAFALQAWLFRRHLIPSAWAAAPVVLILFSPSHYMELLWAWQITLSFSIACPVAALFLLGTLAPDTSRLRLASRFALALGCLLAGTFSSAGGWFGFAAAIVLVVLRPFAWPTRLTLAAILGGIGAFVYLRFMNVGEPTITIGLKQFWQALTALGAVVWGMPVARLEFKFDALSATGLVIVLCTAAIAVRAIWQRRLAELALPLCLALFGFLCVVPIALTRPYLGNWHLQYALPAVCGAYAAGWVLWRSDRTPWARIPFFTLGAILLGNFVGYFQGFRTHGPDYWNYAQSIERYLLRDLHAPGLPAPYPKPGRDLITGEPLLFLAGHQHPLFAELPEPAALRDLPAGSLVYDGETLLDRPVQLEFPRKQVRHLFVVVPEASTGDRVLAQIGPHRVTLLRVHPLRAPAPAPRVPTHGYFAAVLVPHLLGPGPHPVTFQLAP